MSSNTQHHHPHHYPSHYTHSQHQQQSNSGPRAKCDQVVFEAICKACESIVSARSGGGASTHTPSSSSTASNRFNLQIPPVSAIRNILSQHRWQLQQHVPIRMDVYYQHDETSRELLERWCLEYRPAAAERFLQAEGVISSDPMAQLTHVCKRIVVWLRALYCRARYLPAQAIPVKTRQQVGFSVYVHSDQTDDVGDLVHRQGFFLLQPRKNSATITTPYGELTWKVAYSTNIERLLPKRRSIRIQAASKPIPVARRTALQQQRAVAQSAPHYHHHQPQRTSYTERSQQLHKPPVSTYGKSLDPTQLLRPKNPPTRRHTTDELLTATANQAQSLKNGQPQQQQPERVLSALSLALLNAAETEKEGGGALSEEGVMVEQEPFRRAALHEVPAHLQHEDYGYAYNHQIPWQKLKPTSSGSPSSCLLSSPQPQQQQAFLASTPPTTGFLSAASPPLVAPLSGTMTPPFSRPVGFLADAHELSTCTPTDITNTTTTSLHPPPSFENSITTLLPDMPFARQEETGTLASFHSLPLDTATKSKKTTVDDLQQQLQEFKAFGASLLVEDE